MAIIKGITVTLWDHVVPDPDESGESGDESGVPISVIDDFGKEHFIEVPVSIDNVLVAPASSQEILAANDLYSKKAVYTLAIPKGDTHDWNDKRVTFFGKDFHTFGVPLEGIECDIPLDWNKKVTVEVNE